MVHRELRSGSGMVALMCFYLLVHDPTDYVIDMTGLVCED